MKNSTSKRSRKSRASNQDETFSFGSGKPYASNDEYAAKGLLFEILSIEFEPGKGYDGRNRGALAVKVKDREPELMTLGSNPKRDQELQRAQAHLTRGGTLKN